MTAALTELARGFLVAGGYHVIRSGPGFTDLARLGAHEGQTQRLLLWVQEESLPASRDLTEGRRAARDARERELLADFRAKLRVAPEGARAVYLVPRRLGLSAEFVQEASRFLGIRVPVEFFDSEYRRDAAGGEQRASAIQRIIEQSRAVRRVPQPFFVRHGLDPDARTEGGEDLVEHLHRALCRPPERPRLRLIDGSAGIGKTVAFRALVAALYPSFLTAKAQRQAHPRPIPFDEQPLRAAGSRAGAGGRVDDLIDAVIQTELASPVAPTQFDWLLVHGFATWMFDGLDEIYGGDERFYPKLRALLTQPGSVAQILICTRDSLLTSSPRTRAFLEERLAAGDDVEIYELAPWEEGTWRAYSQAELLAAPSPVSLASPARQAQDVVESLAATPSLAALASLPFYCCELVKLAQEDGALFEGPDGTRRDEFDVMELVVLRMLARERGKDLFEWRDFAGPGEGARLGQERILELVQLVAHHRDRQATEGDGLAELPVRVIADLLGIGVDSLDPETPSGRSLVLAVVQLAFFGMGAEEGSVDFSHPLLAEYLAARYAVELLRRRRTDASLRHALGTAEIREDSVLERYIAREVRRDPVLRSWMLDVHRRRSTLRQGNVERFLDRLVRKL